MSSVGHAVDIQLAVEMIDLVLQRLGEEAFGVADAQSLPLRSCALTETRSARFSRPQNPGTDRQPSSSSHVADRLDDLGVDDDRDHVVDVDDRQTQGHADLRRGQADAGRGFHRLDHVVDELLQGAVDLADPLGLLAQNRVADDEDGSNHGRGQSSLPRRPSYTASIAPSSCSIDAPVASSAAMHAPPAPTPSLTRNCS